MTLSDDPTFSPPLPSSESTQHGSAASTVTAPDKEKKWERSQRPPTHPSMGKSSDEQRAWIRATVDFNVRKAEKKSASTIRQYKKKAAYLDHFRDENGILDVSNLGDNPKTFYANRAAIVFMSTVRAKTALSLINGYDRMIAEAKRTGDTKKMEWAKNKKEEQWHLLLIAGNDLAMYPAGRAGSKLPAQNLFVAAQKNYKRQPRSVRDTLLEKPVPPEMGAWRAAIKEKKITPRTPNKGKRRATIRLQKRHPDWRELAFNAVSERWKLQTAVASVTGCRPEEIEGISVQLRSRPDPCNVGQFIIDPEWLTFGIKGVKTNSGHGQPFREMHIQELGNSAFEYLVALAKNGALTVSVPAVNGRSLKNPAAAFRMAIKKAGETFMHGNEPKLSPYCFRHSFACDLKADGNSAELIGVALSHCSTKTQSSYGRANDGVKGRRKVEIDGSLDIKNDGAGRFRRDPPCAPGSAGIPQPEVTDEVHFSMAPNHESADSVDMESQISIE